MITERIRLLTVSPFALGETALLLWLGANLWRAQPVASAVCALYVAVVRQRRP